MKIASNALGASLKSVSALGVMFVLGAGISPAYANFTGGSPNEAINTISPEAPVGANAAASSIPLSPSAASPTNAASPTKNLSSLEDKVSDSIKGSVKQLGSTDSVNLEDMNTARQAVAKLDLLIDIEKRLAELEKVRSDHGGQKALAAAIPASALTPPMSPFPVAKASSSETPVFAPMPPVNQEVSRIAGADGHYVAVVQGKDLRVGDHLSDGSLIIAISASSVSAKSKNGEIRHLKVKGVNEVYGHSL